MFFSLCSPRSVKLDWDLAANLIVSGRRHADATRLRDTLKPRSYIDAIPENVITLDQDVPEVDPNPKQHTPVLRDAFVSLGHHRLHRHRTLDRIHHRRKLKQHAVARGLHEATAVFRHEGVGNLAVFAQGAGGTHLVEPHQPRVARDVSRYYGRQPASDPNWLLLLQSCPAA
jgi:hypothetical protein